MRLIEPISWFRPYADIISVEQSEYRISRPQWNFKDSTEQDILFYHLKPDELSLKLFLERYPSFRYGLLVLDHPPPPQCQIKNFIVLKSDSGLMIEVQKKLSDIFYPLDLNARKLVGVTGTNGKTTTVNLSMQIANMLGKRAFSVGTLGIKTADGELISIGGMTTPPYLELRKKLHELFKNHDIGFMEVSSHALTQDRIYGLSFDSGAWTSFSQDHLDYHASMHEYFEAKMFFLKNHLGTDGRFFIPRNEQDLFEKIQGHPFAQGKRIEVPLTLDERGIKNRPLFFHSQFNKNNLELALALNESILGRAGVHACIDLEKIKIPEGRFNVYQIGHGPNEARTTVIVDYAHTPDAIERICQSIRTDLPFRHLWIVFGCGGNRDRSKRPLMGQAACRYADKVFVTSDNPRFEQPEEIINDISTGLDMSKSVLITDRKIAIETALNEIKNRQQELHCNDTVVLIAGKGHEDYQEIKGVKYSYNDWEVVKKWSEQNF